ncbi:CYTH domain-containing protein [Leptolyngbya sp. BL0902]|uniref:CYTH domain-containing protein n=1 Tax=Leptolyngbya sp. BL0902 TaxID=1115757 RepID=UPI0018E8C1E8|nr:CYTH domain-containing protein [Leptolyngbya sp. BL0902]QQE66868.1 CYTH domain-containing protein [Leptolyngbya sp. BL0902]
MGQEIERKFLVTNDRWRSEDPGQRLCQGYIPTQDARTVRVRVAGDQGYLTLKGPAVGLVRPEFEYAIPLEDAETLLSTLCQPPLIEKIRYRIPIDDVVWEVDEFFGANAGLILAEVELTTPNQPVNLPDWVGEEVTYDLRYSNSNLALHPFTAWS